MEFSLLEFVIGLGGYFAGAASSFAGIRYRDRIGTTKNDTIILNDLIVSGERALTFGREEQLAWRDSVIIGCTKIGDRNKRIKLITFVRSDDGMSMQKLINLLRSVRG